MKFLLYFLSLWINIVAATESSSCLTNKKIDLDLLSSTSDQIKKNDELIYNTTPLNKPLGDIRASEFSKLFNNCILNRINTDYLSRLSDKDLHRLYLSLNTIFFYTMEPHHLEKVIPLINEKKKRKEDITAYMSKLYESYLKTRQFRLARQLAKQHPDIIEDRIPNIIYSKPTSRSLFSPNSNQSLVQNAFEFSDNAEIIVISSAMCGPSKRFKTWLNSNPKMLNLFSKKSTWIIPQTAPLYVKQMLDYNINNSSLNMSFVDKEANWPEIKYWGTPTLYFYYNGKLLKQLVGWPREGREKELIAALDLIGLSISDPLFSTTNTKN